MTGKHRNTTLSLLAGAAFSALTAFAPPSQAQAQHALSYDQIVSGRVWTNNPQARIVSFSWDGTQSANGQLSMRPDPLTMQATLANAAADSTVIYYRQGSGPIQPYCPALHVHIPTPTVGSSVLTIKGSANGSTVLSKNAAQSITYLTCFSISNSPPPGQPDQARAAPVSAGDLINRLVPPQGPARPNVRAAVPAPPQAQGLR
jgi:hypothetical protein